MNDSAPVNTSGQPSSGSKSFSFMVTNLCLVVTIIVAIFGNSLVCAACVISKRLQRFAGIFIISLAASDILVGLASMPVWLSVQLTGKPDRVNFPKVYTAWLCFDIMCGTASIMNLVFISIDRFLAVNHPLRYPMIMTQSRALVGALFVWVYSIAIAALYLMRWSNYLIFVSTMSFFAPLLIMVAAYLQIFRVALAHARSIRRVNTERSITYWRTAERFSHDLKAARTLSIVIGAFVICWCPFFVVGLLALYCRTCKLRPEILVMSKWLHYGNSAVNPFIYGCLNSHFRSTFKTILVRAFGKLYRCS